MDLYANYTDIFAPGSVPPTVNTTCDFKRQTGIQDPNNINTTRVSIEFVCSYASRLLDVTGYPLLFEEYVNQNLDQVANDIRDLGINVTDVFPVSVLVVPDTTAPTASEAPSQPPSLSPTITNRPSTIPPTELPQDPTLSPTEDFFRLPTQSPTQMPSGRPRVSVPAIASIVVLSGVAILIALVVYYRRKIKQRQSLQGRPGAGGFGSEVTSLSASGAALADARARSKDAGDSDVAAAALSPSGSMVSGQSMLSEGESGFGGESGDENDHTKNLQDEFDQYKDQNLEQLRADVEGNLTGFEGIMSAAVTKALMGDEDIRMDTSELLWGCHETSTGPEIEASALCDVCDWLKRNENASVERKHQFMQDMLNKMVASVRHAKLDAEDASRTIHESAALLGLPLANELPMTTMIISGMRKTVAASQIVNVLDEFGDIDTAAVASGERGFGLVRFRHPKSVERAMRRYRNAEIVVEDVAVQLRVLMPSGEVISRT